MSLLFSGFIIGFFIGFSLYWIFKRVERNSGSGYTGYTSYTGYKNTTGYTGHVNITGYTGYQGALRDLSFTVELIHDHPSLPWKKGDRFRVTNQGGAGWYCIQGSATDRWTGQYIGSAMCKVIKAEI